MLYNLQYRDTATLTTTTVTGIDALFYDLTGLTNDKKYEFRVQEDDGTTTSDYSEWEEFETGYPVYNLQYRDVATQTTRTIIGVGKTFYNLSGLERNTPYEFRVQEDDGTTQSAFTAWEGFETGNTCIPPFAFEGVPNSLGFGSLSDDSKGGLFGSVYFQGCAAIALNPATVNAIGNIGEPVNGTAAIQLNPATANAVGIIDPTCIWFSNLTAKPCYG